MENSFVFLAFISGLLFFFPIRTEGTVLFRKGKFGFSVSLFPVRNLFGGYIEAERDGLSVHYSRKRALFLPFKALLSDKEMLDWRQGFQLYDCSVIAELNGGKGSVIPICMYAEGTIRELFRRWKKGRPFLRLQSDLILSGTEESSVLLQGKFIFNLFTLTRATIKIMIGRVITALWKKK